MLTNLHEMGEVSFLLIGKNGFYIEAESERFTAASSRCRQNLIRELKRRQRQRKCHLKINIWQINGDYFVVIASSSCPLLLTEHAANGLLEAPLN